MSKLICFLGAPSSGKSTLASEVHTQLKVKGLNSIFVGESATDYIAEYGIPSTPLDQMTVFYKQLNREKMYIGSKDYIVCDSSSLLNYFYFRQLFIDLSNKNIAVINHMQKEILKSISQWSYIFYLPPMGVDVNDGIRFHDQNQISKIDRWIKSYLELENIPHIDLSSIEISNRPSSVINHII